jgi:hypothetical protein
MVAVGGPPALGPVQERPWEGNGPLRTHSIRLEHTQLVWVLGGWTCRGAVGVVARMFHSPLGALATALGRRSTSTHRPPPFPSPPPPCLSPQSSASTDTPSSEPGSEFDLKRVDAFLASRGISPGSPHRLHHHYHHTTAAAVGHESGSSSVGSQALEDALDLSGRLRRVGEVLSSTAGRVGGGAGAGGGYGGPASPYHTGFGSPGSDASGVWDAGARSLSFGGLREALHSSNRPGGVGGGGAGGGGIGGIGGATVSLASAELLSGRFGGSAGAGVRTGGDAGMGTGVGGSGGAGSVAPADSIFRSGVEWDRVARDVAAAAGAGAWSGGDSGVGLGHGPSASARADASRGGGGGGGGSSGGGSSGGGGGGALGALGHFPAGVAPAGGSASAGAPFPGPPAPPLQAATFSPYHVFSVYGPAWREVRAGGVSPDSRTRTRMRVSCGRVGSSAPSPRFCTLWMAPRICLRSHPNHTAHRAPRTAHRAPHTAHRASHTAHRTPHTAHPHPHPAPTLTPTHRHPHTLTPATTPTPPPSHRMQVSAKAREAGAGSITVHEVPGAGSAAAAADDSAPATVHERDVLLCLHTLLGVLSTRAQTIHDLSMGPSRSALEASGAATAHAGAAGEIARLRKALATEQRERAGEGEALGRRLRDAEDRVRALTAAAADLRHKVSHSEHRVRQREAELEEVKLRLRKRQGRCGRGGGGERP